MIKLPDRQPIVPNRRLELSEQNYKDQINKGLYTTQKGQKLAIPIDKIGSEKVFKHRVLWVNDQEHGIHRPGARFKPHGSDWQTKILQWGNKHISPQFSYRYYLATLGHDIHISSRGDLFAKHWHRDWVNPFNPENYSMPFEINEKTIGQLGFVENCGWLSGGKITTAFRDNMVAELVAATEFQDYDFHEVGTSSTAEANSQTALIATSGIARVTGSPTDSAPIYQNIGTITADTTETWEEHGLFNNSSGATLMDRSITSGQSVNSSDQVQYTYQLTVNAEA